MIIFEGASSLSKFRHKRLLQKLQNQVPKIENLSANFVHFARCSKDLTKYERYLIIFVGILSSAILILLSVYYIYTLKEYCFCGFNLSFSIPFS